ncbi:MAG: hypothetical protein O2971_19690 [Proteobacteria bacterium]|nr:hypothetical protein [Pseudomonadota bacterium]
MRALTEDELELVHGGVGIVGAGIGAAIGAGGAAVSGGNLGQIVGAGILGGVSGFFGGIATSGYATGISRGLFSLFSIETGIMSGAAGS